MKNAIFSLIFTLFLTSSVLAQLPNPNPGPQPVPYPAPSVTAGSIPTNDDPDDTLCPVNCPVGDWGILYPKSNNLVVPLTNLQAEAELGVDANGFKYFDVTFKNVNLRTSSQVTDLQVKYFCGPTSLNLGWLISQTHNMPLVPANIDKISHHNVKIRVPAYQNPAVGPDAYNCAIRVDLNEVMRVGNPIEHPVGTHKKFMISKAGVGIDAKVYWMSDGGQ